MKMCQKSKLLTLLRTGYTRSALTVNDLPYFLRPFFCPLDEGGKGLCINLNHPFFDAENRAALIRDIYAVHSFEVTDHSFFRILNNFENGDAYGTKKTA